MKTQLSTKLILLAILILAGFLRLYGINWDQGHHLHPDERAILIAVDQLKFPGSISEFLSPQSTWNPHFFAYGSFPMYILRISGNVMGIFNPLFAQYGLINLVGRAISAFADIITIVLLFKIARKLFNPTVGLLSAFFYAISVLPIQLSHFYAVDTLLTCFILATLYCLILFYEKPTLGRSILIGVSFGLALATKVSALVLLVSIGTMLAADFALIFLKRPHKPTHWLPHLPSFIKHLLKYAFVIFMSSVFTFIIFEPYAVIDFGNFWQQTIQQSALTIDPFYFPYTLQYVGKIPYLYELKNVFLWGLGPAISSFAFMGICYFIFGLFKNSKNSHSINELILFIFFFAYFLTVGKFSVGFMRYMLPLYPIFALFAALFVYKIIKLINNRLKNKPLLLISHLSFLILALAWPLSFIRIYSLPNTRVTASNWIYDNIPANSTIAVEHWDDQLPIGQPKTSLGPGGQSPNFNTQTLKLYDQDSTEKWDEINLQLSQSDFVIIASNRLYAPIQKLTDCKNLPPHRCYPRTTDYYKKLFSGQLGFQKVAEFTNYPSLPILSIPIPDQSADENFTVFDHPKIMIFRKTNTR